MMMGMMKSKYVFILAILLLAFTLRVWMLNERPLWYDEAFSVFLSERGLAAIVSGTAVDTDPPGYYFLLALWMNGVGQAPFALRMLGVAFSVLIVAMVYALGKRAFDARAAHWAALLVALFPFQIYHAQEARMYTLLGLGVCLYMYGVIDLSLSPHEKFPRRALACVFIGTLLALWAQNLAFATFFVGHIYLLWRARREPRMWRKELQLVGAQFAAVLFYIPWLFYLPSQLAKVQRAFYTQAPGFLDVLQLMMLLTTYLPLPPLFTAFVLFVTILVLAFALWFLIKLARRKKFPAMGIVSAFALAPPLVLFVLSYLMRPVFVPRGLVVVGFAYALLLGLLVSRAPRVLQTTLLVLTILFYGALLPFYYSAYGEWRRAPYAEANAFLRTQLRDGDVVLHDNKLTFFPMHYYDRALPQVFLADPPNSDNDTLARGSQEAMQLFPTDFENALAGKTRVWFVMYQTALDEAREANVPHANLARLDKTFQRVQTNEYGDVRILLYTIP